jgi:hypothetical protein
MNLCDQKGAVAEVLVAARFLELGYAVLAPVLDQRPRYDLVVEKAGRFQRVQVKTGYRAAKNTLTCGAYGSSREAYTSGDADLIAVYDPTDREVYAIPTAALAPGQKRFCINVGDRKIKSTKFRGSEYRLC